MDRTRSFEPGPGFYEKLDIAVEHFYNPKLLNGKLRYDPMTSELGRIGAGDDETKIIFDDVLKNRAEELNKLGIKPADRLKNRLATGALLKHMLNETINDGAEEAATDGFFDVDDVPPKDTWVEMVVGDPKDYRESFIIAWIPREYIFTAGRGISEDPIDINNWVDRVIDRK